MRKLSRNSKDGIIGFAIGDALGVPVEFINRKELSSYTDVRIWKS